MDEVRLLVLRRRLSVILDEWPAAAEGKREKLLAEATLISTEIRYMERPVHQSAMDVSA